MRRVIRLFALAACFAAVPAFAEDPAPGDVLAATKIRAGLAVHLAPADVGLARALAGGKTHFLVHVLAPDSPAFSATAVKLATDPDLPAGVVSASRWADRPNLPYATNLVNLLVADLDALGPAAPKRDEILRVLAPNGAAYLKQSGTWAAVTKPMPKEYDDWRHFDGDETGDHMSNDTAVRPPNAVLWIANDMEVKTGNNPAAYKPLQGIRVAGGRAFYYVQPDRKPGEKWGRRFRVVARNAYSGVLEWSADTPKESYRQSFTATPESVYLYAGTNEGAKLSALDAATGEASTVDQSLAVLPWPKVENKRGINDPNLPDFAIVRDAGDLLLQSRGHELVALDKKTGRRAWRFATEFPRGLLALSVDTTNRRVFTVVSDGSTFMGQPYDMVPRWPRGNAAAVVALDLVTGKELWRAEFKGQHVGQLLPAGKDHDKLVVHGAYPDGCVGVLDAATGKRVWLHDHVVTGKRICNYNALVRGDKVFVEYFSAGPTAVKTFDLADGKEATYHPGGINSRCVRMAATPNYLIFGLGWFVDKDDASEFVSTARPGCAHSLLPAYGNLYYSPNACGCLSNLRGTIALTYEAPRPPVADAKRTERLVNGGAPAAAPGEGKRPANPLADDFLLGDWSRQLAAIDVAPVTDGGLTYTVDPAAHTLTATEGDAVRWVFAADARISAAPLVHEGMLYLTAHDGYVYSLDPKTGACRWRFLAAPGHRYITFNGQLQSAWPIYSLAVHEGNLCVAAGLHAETGGGIELWGLNPATGAPAWHQVLTVKPFTLPPYTANARADVPAVAQHQPMNRGLALVDGQLKLDGFVINPKESQTELDARLNAPPPSRKR